ncbi:hypothetical protein [Pseudohongiella acticola]|jgi:uncharacterized membrane protein AbrB (regulator of aidB expression)|uniref:hypothetical protein n=1 Tax=Pseudohongiella acticola TaxID=1524254 RepID=UPI0030EB74D5
MKSSPISFVFIMTNVITAILALCIIAVPIFMHAFDGTYQLPNVIKEWGGVVVGYYFGSSLTLFVKYFESESKSSKPESGT